MAWKRAVRIAGRRCASTWARSTRCCRPSSSRGFYYKTFMWPAAFWEKVYEPLIRRAAGLGRASEQFDPDTYEKAHAFCDVLVVGGGAAGIGRRARPPVEPVRARHSLRRGFRAGRSLDGDRREIDGLSGADWARARGRRAGISVRRTSDASNDSVRCLRWQYIRRTRASLRSSADTAAASAAPAPVEDRGEARRCWRPARSSGRWCLVATTDPA